MRSRSNHRTLFLGTDAGCTRFFLLRVLPFVFAILVWCVTEGVATEPSLQEADSLRSDPRARAALLVRHYQLPDDESIKNQVWSLMKGNGLVNSEIGLALNHAFNLTILYSGENLWCVFDRRTAPEFVYIRPQAFAIFKDDLVVQEGTMDSIGNGVEVHPESSGRGPFAWGITRADVADCRTYEFRVYYEVTRAPTMQWLEGHQNYLRLRVRR